MVRCSVLFRRSKRNN